MTKKDSQKQKITLLFITQKQYMPMEKEEVRYKKNAMRLTLQANMRVRRGEPELVVTPMEFSRWLRYYCEDAGLAEDVMRAKELPESIADGFGKWLGDSLLVQQPDGKAPTTPLIGKGD